MVMAYSKADKSFDPKKFLSFCETVLAKEETDSLSAAELRRQARQYADDRIGADAPTATASKKPPKPR